MQLSRGQKAALAAAVLIVIAVLIGHTESHDSDVLNAYHSPFNTLTAHPTTATAAHECSDLQDAVAKGQPYSDSSNHRIQAAGRQLFYAAYGIVWNACGRPVFGQASSSEALSANIQRGDRAITTILSLIPKKKQ